MEHLFHLQNSGALRYVILLVEGKMFFSEKFSDFGCTTFDLQSTVISNIKLTDNEAGNYDQYLTRRIILDMSSYQHLTIRRITRRNATEIDFFENFLEERRNNPILVPTIWAWF